MNVLILGSGGREHVLAWKAAQSHIINKLFVAPGNAGTAQIAQNVDLSVMDFSEIAEFCKKSAIDVLIPGSEDPLVSGIVDFMESYDGLDMFVLGPNKEAAQLEGSKEYAKSFMIENDIPTAKYQSFTSETIKEAKAYLRTKTAPYVLKADGLAAGKGVVISETLEHADATLDDMLLDKKFGDASSRVVIEDFLSGVEFSIFALSDGENYIVLPEAKDYKRIGEQDTGLNTGGMGAVSPVPFMNEAYLQTVTSEIIQPTFEGLKKRNMPFVGFVFFGLINDNGAPKVIEYNVRMGDPETEVVFPRVLNDFGQILKLAANKRLNEVKMMADPRTCATVFAVSGGYPESYEKDKRIEFRPHEAQDTIVFHAGTKLDENDILTNGGRVLAVSAFGDSIQSAITKSYKGIQNISFDKMYYRKDIGQDLLTLSK
ncbi:MAG: phosphoribosylamine--glycine ligase [Bacteroidia bacterium]|jgi:phosphoribosylamine--glycine ligase